MCCFVELTFLIPNTLGQEIKMVKPHTRLAILSNDRFTLPSRNIAFYSLGLATFHLLKFYLFVLSGSTHNNTQVTGETLAL